MIISLFIAFERFTLYNFERLIPMLKPKIFDFFRNYE